MKINKDPQLTGVIRITGDQPGPRAVMFAGIHGDEVSGIHALDKLLFDLAGGERKLARGSLTLARGNAQALAAERRYIQLNLNRMFKDSYDAGVDASAYEYKRAQELKKILEDCDYFLDFHSAPIAQEPFAVAEGKALEFFSRLGFDRIITDWSKFSSGPTGGDAETYANRHGARAATLESGSHFEKSSIDVAYKTAISFVSLLEMLEVNEPPKAAPPDVFQMYAVITKQANDFHYVPGVKNFQFFQKGSAFAYQKDKPVVVGEDTYLLIPMEPEKTKINEEVCYLGRKQAA